MEMSKKIFLSIVLLLVFASVSFGADYYVAQTASGTEDGSSCANADAIADLTWGSGGMVDAGDTLHLCGTITSTLTIGASGTSGNEITIKFEDGAKLSAPVWGTYSTAAIYAVDRDYIIIDGGTNGVIENTDNGTGLTYQQDSYGIYLSYCDNVEIKNLTLQNLYVRTPDSSDPDGSGTFILADDCNNLSLHDLVINYAEYAFRSMAHHVSISGLEVYNCDISKVANGGVASLAGAYNYSDVSIHDNQFYDFAPTWDGEWTVGTSTYWHHVDGLQFWGNYASNTLGTLKIYNNYFHGDFGAHQTSHIYWSDYVTPVEVYNNVFDNSIGPDHASHGSIFASSVSESSTCKIYNNTIIGYGSTNTGGSGVNIRLVDTEIKNNIFKNLYVGIILESGDANLQSDYNDYYNVGSVGKDTVGGTGYYGTLSSWQTFLGGCQGTDNECNSIDSDPGIGTDYKPTDFSSSVVDAGTDLGSDYNIDKVGVSRPQGSAWDIGAYEYDYGTNDTTPPVMSSGGPSGKLTCLTVPRKVTLTVTTDEIATCKYDTSDTDYDSMTGTFTTTGGTSHSTALWLSCGADYNYYIRCMDWSGNKNTSSEHVSFTLKSVRRPVLAGPNAITVSGVPVGK